MTIAPIFVVLAVAAIITLSLGCFCFAMAWARAEAENSQLRRNRVARALGFPAEEQR